MERSSVAWDGLSNSPLWWARSLPRLTNFINGFLFGVDRSKSARNGESSSPGALHSHLASVLGLQLNLEIALGGASAKVKAPPTSFSEPAESALRRRMT